MEHWLLKLNATDCPRSVGRPSDGSEWENGYFMCGMRRGAQPRPGDEVLVWVNETNNGEGLTAKARVSMFETTRIRLEDVELFDRPLLNNAGLGISPRSEDRLHQQGIIKNIRAVAGIKLRSLSDDEFRELLSLARRQNDLAADLEEIANREELDRTTRRALRDARLGQGKFRSELEKRWQHACAASGCDIREMLRASHLKPWRNPTDAQRLDPENGLLLTANLDALFDRGLISFSDDGGILISQRILPAKHDSLGLNVNLRLELTTREREYLKYHRDHCFKQ